MEATDQTEPTRRSTDLRLRKRLRVALAEDDEALREVIVGLLRSQGLEVIEIDDGESLFDYLESGYAAGHFQPPDLVISDLAMPHLSGLQVLERLRAVEHAPPFLIITAYGTDEVRDAAARLGAAAVLEKPFGTAELLRAIRRYSAPETP